MSGKIVKTVRVVCRRLGLADNKFDYRSAYARSDLRNDYWSVVGPATRDEFEVLGGVKRQFLVDLGLGRDGKVLDVGCGTGLLARSLEDYLSDQGHYVGADLAPEAIEFCRKRFHRSNFEFVVNEMTALPLAVPIFDAIVFYSVFTHTFPDETVLLLAEARRLLAAGGFVFADAFTSPAVEGHDGDRSAVVVNEDRLRRLTAVAGFEADEVMTLAGPRCSTRRFWKLTPRG